MTSSNANEYLLVDAALEFLPPRLKSSLLNNDEFVQRWNLALVAKMTLGMDGPCFQRDQLFEGIRAAIRVPGIEVEISDDQSVTWRLQAQNKDGRLSFVLQHDEILLSIPDHSGLAEDHNIRTEWFERAIHEVNLQGSILECWRTKIGGGPLSDNEFSELISDLEQMPISNYRSIHGSLLRGNVDIGTLVPSARSYYDRLVGPYGHAVNADAYIDSKAADLIDNAQQWDAVQGFLMSLLICSKRKVSEFIRIDRLNEEERWRCYEWISTKGDPISQIGAVEVALKDIEKNRALEPFVERIVDGFISDNAEGDGGCFSLLSSMVVLVGSELSRRGILKGTSPFYRRQAAIAQASLIIRALKVSQTESASIVRWAKNSGFGHVFFLQGLVDLRLEPRWLPDFASSQQFRAEFIGRIMNAVLEFKGEIRSESLRRMLIGEDSPLASAAEWPFPMLPGPLEGELTLGQPDIPNEVLEDVTAGLQADRLEPASFAGIVNMALLYKMPATQAGLAATALRRVRYSIENADDEDSTFGLIGGLANVAAVTRATDLAETLRVLARVMRRRNRLNAEPDDELRIAMVAAASHEGLEDWARFAGEWVTELAYEVVEKHSAQSFLLKLRWLVQIEPALARHFAVADAALASIVR